MLSPSASIREDIRNKDAFLLFVAFAFISMSLSGVFVSFFKLASLFDGSIYAALAEAGVAAQLLALWTSVNTCHVFAISSFTLGKSFYFLNTFNNPRAIDSLPGNNPDI